MHHHLRQRLLATTIMAVLGCMTLPAYAGVVCAASDGLPSGAIAGTDATACGTNAQASAKASSAYGSNSKASDEGGSAFGAGSEATDSGSSAFGNVAKAAGRVSVAVGSSSRSLGLGDIAIGYQAVAQSAATYGGGSLAIGMSASAKGDGSYAGGQSSHADGEGSTALGAQSNVMGAYSIAVGAFTFVQGKGSVASGVYSGAFGDYNVVYGAAATAVNPVTHGAVTNAVAVGSFVDRDNNGQPSGDLSESTVAGANGAAAFGSGAQALGIDSFAGGYLSRTLGKGSVALGAYSVAAEDGVISVGHRASDLDSARVAYGSALVRRITNVADPLNASDAATKDYVDMRTTQFDANTLHYDDVTKAAASLAGAGGTVIHNLAAGVASTDAVNKAQLDAVVAQAGNGSANAVEYDGVAHDSITLAGAGGTAIHQVAAGVDGKDAVNKDQLDAVDGRVAQVSQQADANTRAIGDLDGRVGVIEGQLGHVQQMAATLDYLSVDGAADGSDAASVSGAHAVAIGANARAGGDRGTAVGGDSYAAGPNDTALGGHARVDADGSTAVGANTAIGASATHAVAVGEGASVTAASGTALGQGAAVTAEGAVALGQGAVADQANTVSVGSASQQRRVTQVAAGVAATDAVNVQQLDGATQDALDAARQYSDAGDRAMLNSANAYTDQQVSRVGLALDQFKQQVDNRFHLQDRRISRVSAMNAASTSMAVGAAGARGNGRFAAGVGFSGGQAALSVGYATPLSERSSLNFSGAFSGQESSAGIGFGVDL